MQVAFSISVYLSAAPEEVYNAWLRSNRHTEMTGSKAKIGAETGTDFSAQDGYISGRNLLLLPPNHIVQSWRTKSFAAGDSDSQVEISLLPENDGTKLILLHSNIPKGQPDYKQWWSEHYFVPMEAYFAKMMIPVPAMPEPF
ncbi:SRPBCC domain-containing protein [Taibaiella soli]|uniref:Activator of Hsp90 ATPase homologue 1/2-like C-terminal domain-containing protein n=1 Tax=Taibaiella soli TaxID=1649169 RepID=A0A2W2ACM9_9BACT|nr:SRPBCC domain-containing protein [Taibaiella soli]PZF73185.1 hypothetical protein DN068_09955 [Taibaiella soli]